MQRIFSLCFGILFLVLFSFVLMASRFISDASILLTSVLMLGLLAIALTLYGGLCKYRRVFEMRETTVLVITIGGYFILQSIVAYKLAITTAWDVEAVYMGASNIAKHGSLQGYVDYFHMFPHNLGSVALLALVFKAAILIGIDDLYSVGCFLNIVLIDIAFLFVYLVIKRLRSLHDAYHGLLLCLFCLPLLFYTPVFYSDTLSICFSLIVFYTFLCGIDTKSWSMSWLLSVVAAGASLYVGASIKVTVLFIPIAILVVALIEGKLKSAVIYVLALFIVFKVFSMLIAFAFNDRHLDASKLEYTKIPYSHWLMMGLQGNGSYSPGDYELTKSLDTQAARIAANVSKSVERLYSMGYSGFYELGKRKQLNNFGNGAYAVSEMLDDGPVRPGRLHEFALSSGDSYRGFAYFTQAFHLMLMLVIALGALVDALLAKTRGLYEINVLRMSLFGLFVFLLFWETNSRYMINYLPIFIVLAQLSMAELFKCLRTRMASIKNRPCFVEA